MHRDEVENVIQVIRTLLTMDNKQEAKSILKGLYGMQFPDDMRGISEIVDKHIAEYMTITETVRVQRSIKQIRDNWIVQPLGEAAENGYESTGDISIECMQDSWHLDQSFFINHGVIEEDTVDFYIIMIQIRYHVYDHLVKDGVIPTPVLAEDEI